MTRQHRITLITDPRFAGGTSSALAREIFALSPTMDLNLVYLETAMFKTGRNVNPRLVQATEACGLHPTWNPPLIAAETVVYHNPSGLKFDAALSSRITCRRLVVVAHENFMRPDGSLSYDVAKTLGLLADRTVTEDLVIAPVSAANRLHAIDNTRAVLGSPPIRDRDGPLLRSTGSTSAISTL